MKSVFVAVLSIFVVSAAASAAEKILIRSLPYQDSLSVDGIRYRVNGVKGRAWAQINTSVRGTDHEGGTTSHTGYHYESYDTQVPGLAYEGNQIVFASDVGKVICAEVASTSSKLLIHPTGLCGFSVARGQREVDDGFDSHFERTIDVYFNFK